MVAKNGRQERTPKMDAIYLGRHVPYIIVLLDDPIGQLTELEVAILWRLKDEVWLYQSKIFEPTG